MTAALSAADYERARSWLTVIAEAILVDPEWDEDANGERKYRGTAGLSINVDNAVWYDFGHQVGGISAIWLISHLKKCAYDDALVWLQAFLANSPGLGPCGRDVEGEAGAAEAAASAAACRDALDAAVEWRGTGTETYFQSRGIVDFPAGLLGHIEHVRLGESAAIARVWEHDRETGVMLTYLTPSGSKSLVRPNRRRFNLEKSPGGAFRILPPDPAGPLDPVADYLVCEGLEDALSLFQLGRNLTIIGMPGIGALPHLGFKKGDRVTVIRDGDEPDSPAAARLTAGVDALLLAGAHVRVSQTALGEDANRVLLYWGIDILRELAARPPEAPLSFTARITKLSQIPDPVAAAKERATIAKVFGVSVKVIDEELRKLRPPRGKPATSEEDDGVPLPEPDPEWPGEVDLGAALDTAVNTMRRFLVAPDWGYHVLALWAPLTHLVQSEEIALPVMPQLAFQSVSESSGKSIALEITATLVCRGHLRSSYTASTLFRKIHDHQVTPCLSELHNILHERNSEMLAILDACHRRAEAYVDRTETDAKTGKRYVVSYACWTAVAWASIGLMPGEIQSRAISIPLQAALPGESARLDHSSPSRCPELIDVRRQFAKWAAGMHALPPPKTMPLEIFNRGGDNFRPLFSVAELAKGKWPQRIRNAVDELRKVERRPSLRVRLLTDICTILEAAEDQRLSTADLIDALCAEEERGWHQANHHRRIDAYWLREELRGLIDPPGSQQWRPPRPQGGPAVDPVRGYELRQFQNARLRYLLIGGVPASATSTTSATAPPRPAETADISVADAAGGVPDEPDASSHPLHEKPRKAATERTGEVDVSDVADTGRAPPYVEEDNITSAAAAAKPSGPPVGAKGGATPKARPGRKTLIADAIRATKAAHPEWSDARVGKHCGRSESVVRRILNPEPAT